MSTASTASTEFADQAAATVRENWERFKTLCFAAVNERNAIEKVVDAQAKTPSAKALKAELAKLPSLAQQAQAARNASGHLLKFVAQARLQAQLKPADQALCTTIDNTLAGYLKLLEDVDKSVRDLASLGKKRLQQVALQKEAAELARRQSAELDLLLEGDELALRTAIAELRTASDQGWKLFMARDQGALDALRRQAKLPATLERMGRPYDEALAALKDQPQLKHLAAGAKAELAATLKALAKRRASLDIAALECRSLKARLNDLQVVPVDLDRAVRQLKIDRSHKAEVAQALQGNEAQMQRGLDGLARKLKLKFSGKDLFGRLRKAQLV